MLIFIDESGDAGFKIERGSSKSFTICCVCFHKSEDAEQASSIIKQVRLDLALPRDKEFKFTKHNKRIRTGFLNAVLKAKFSVHAIVFQKNLIYSDTLRNRKDRFYNFATRHLLDSL
ncbi:MAG: DUF3800 domain-containing protein, partial [Cyanobacteria bacterium HKST-UBA03]|nr:DUF3800 domain-containing protein [Cyanobacteria bacterium HKST-UBA03]